MQSLNDLLPDLQQAKFNTTEITVAVQQQVV